MTAYPNSATATAIAAALTVTIAAPAFAQSDTAAPRTYTPPPVGAALTYNSGTMFDTSPHTEHVVYADSFGYIARDLEAELGELGALTYYAFGITYIDCFDDVLDPTADPRAPALRALFPIAPGKTATARLSDASTANITAHAASQMSIGTETVSGTWLHVRYDMGQIPATVENYTFEEGVLFVEQWGVTGIWAALDGYVGRLIRIEPKSRTALDISPQRAKTACGLD